MARYVDIEPEIQELQSVLNERKGEANSTVFYMFQMVLKNLKSIPTADVVPRSEWISVDERLPDCEYGAETEALLFRLKTGTVEAGYFGTGGIFRDKYFRCYHHANEGWDAKDVTHWMPLPEPPEGDAS